MYAIIEENVHFLFPNNNNSLTNVLKFMIII